MDAVVNTVPLARLVALGPDPLLGAAGPDLVTFELLVPGPPPEDGGAPPLVPAHLVVVPAGCVAPAPGAAWPVPVGTLLALEFAANLTRAAAEAGTLGVRVLPGVPAP